MANQLDSGGSGGGTASTTEEQKKGDFEETTTTTQDPNDGDELESRGDTTTETTTDTSTDSTSTTTQDPNDGSELESRGDTTTDTTTDTSSNTSSTSSDSTSSTTEQQPSDGEGLESRGEATTGEETVEADEPETSSFEEEQYAEEGESTARANQSVSLGTTGVGTSGTRRSRSRERTARANQSESLGTDLFTTQGRTTQQDSSGSDTIEQSDEIGGEATTAADRDLQEAEQEERVRSDIEQQLEEEGVDPDNVDISVDRTADGFETEVTAEDELADIDWSLGLGDPEVDEVERFVDQQIGQGGSEFVRENVSGPLRGVGEGLKNADILGSGPDEPATARALDGDFDAAPGTDTASSDSDDSGIGPGQAAGNFVIGAANVAEAAPRIPGVALEAAEGANFLLEATPAAGGSEEQFDRRVEQSADVVQSIAEEEAERARNNPGEFAGEAAVGFGAGRLLSATTRISGARTALDSSAARQATTRYSPDVPDGDSADLGSSSRQSGPGTGGTGSLLDADTVDAARGIDGPSRVALARGRASRAVDRTRSRVSDTVSRINIDTNRVGAGLVPPDIDLDPPRSRDGPENPTEFNPSRDEILKDSPRDRISSDVSSRTLREVRDAEGDFDRSGPAFRPDRGPTLDPETRQVRPGTDGGPATGRSRLTDPDTDSSSTSGGSASASGVAAGTTLATGAIDRTRTDVDSETGVFTVPGNDSQSNTDLTVTPGSRPDTGTDVRPDTRGDTRLDQALTPDTQFSPEPTPDSDEVFGQDRNRGPDPDPTPTPDADPDRVRVDIDGADNGRREDRLSSLFGDEQRFEFDARDLR